MISWTLGRRHPRLFHRRRQRILMDSRHPAIHTVPPKVMRRRRHQVRISLVVVVVVPGMEITGHSPRRRHWPCRPRQIRMIPVTTASRQPTRTVLLPLRQTPMGLRRPTHTVLLQPLRLRLIRIPTELHHQTHMGPQHHPRLRQIRTEPHRLMEVIPTVRHMEVSALLRVEHRGRPRLLSIPILVTVPRQRLRPKPNKPRRPWALHLPRRAISRDLRRNCRENNRNRRPLRRNIRHPPQLQWLIVTILP
mmetsp:Transcript_4029/g.8085  ORF Transcript_4029/g.8085 Transcript_4029/m.8085 type:complete len:249 (-) Transcript_4029:137-883(-)